MRIIMLCLMICLTLPRNGSAQSGSLSAVVQAFSAQGRSTVGFDLIDLGTGKHLYSHHPEALMIPASTLKLITTGAALEILGPQYRFKTCILVRKSAHQDTLLMNISGNGDPTLGSGRFGEQSQADKVLDTILRSIRRSAGSGKYSYYRVITDMNAQANTATPGSWLYADIGNYYAAMPGRINFEENQYRIGFELYGKKSEIEVVPDSLHPEAGIDNQLRIGTVSSGDQCYVYSSPDYASKIILRGSIPVLHSHKFSVKARLFRPDLYLCYRTEQALGNPPASYQHWLEKRLKSDNDLIASETTGTYDTALVLYSPPLKEIVSETNIHSINLYAEALLRAMQDRLNHNGSGSGLKGYFEHKGLAFSSANIEDACGLSRLDALSASQFTELLRYFVRTGTDRLLESGLAISGQRGDLAQYADIPAVNGRISAKSGYMSGVRSLAAYVKTTSGKRLAFCLIINQDQNSNYPQLIRRLFTALVAM